ncbi:hypothetical protein [Streptomyces halobius]|uniref:YCII-related domain-containing protein n=1 Tax=Streptomyces halobius TaxID=2879846 RepID=A0ABY4M7E2_9ACTN|nr:hypothetical protein [Streptomyces halobius]UQA93672.1 hypothetical protein K9S39_19030 [Streptomyces halobius]
MGAIEFFTTATGTDLDTAFSTARDEAAWERGHGGYTGAVAEKDEVTLLDEPRRSEAAAMARAEELICAGDPRIDDKWGPAGALPLTTDSGEDGWLFFGFASC